MPETVAELEARTGRTAKEIWAQIKRGKLSRVSRGRYDPTSDAPGWLRGDGATAQVATAPAPVDDSRCSCGGVLIKDFYVSYPESEAVSGRMQGEMRALFEDPVRPNGPDIAKVVERHRQEWTALYKTWKAAKPPTGDYANTCTSCGRVYGIRKDDECTI